MRVEQTDGRKHKKEKVEINVWEVKYTKLGNCD